MLNYQLQNSGEEKIDLEESRKLGDEWLNSDLKRKVEEERRKKKEEAEKDPRNSEKKTI